MKKKEPKDVEINDLVLSLHLEERVKCFTKECIDTNPQLADQATMGYVSALELATVVNSGKSCAKITILDELEAIGKSTEMSGSKIAKM